MDSFLRSWQAATGNARIFFPAAGNGNGASLNNRGTNGNYWSRSWNSSDNGYNLNFNSSNVNPQNNNNRYNGYSVRAVQHLPLTAYGSKMEDSMAYTLTRDALLADLYAAFLCARQHKAAKPYVRHFERRLMENLSTLADALHDRTYRPEPSTCFIIERPKKREVFAAQFRDRVVHHLYYNYTHRLFERTFIHDSYSCIPGRGTHYGIDRLKHHILKESHSYQRPCYVLKLDIRGYFMHIVRQWLLEIALESLEKMRTHKVAKGSAQTWGDAMDYDFIRWLTREIILLNPIDGCRVAGSRGDWAGLDPSKSLRYAGEGRGLPIGNLTSQLFSNVYLNLLDQHMKRTLGCKHYGRYVDDAYVVSHDRRWLLSIVPQVREFLGDALGLELHSGKLQLCDAYKGVSFLGAYVKPYRTYIDSRSLERTAAGIGRIDTADADATYRAVNSYLGILSHYDSYNLRRQLLLREPLLQVATFDNDITIFNKPTSFLNTNDYEQNIRKN